MDLCLKSPKPDRRLKTAELQLRVMMESRFHEFPFLKVLTIMGNSKGFIRVQLTVGHLLRLSFLI
jgi:hypothetical protein